MKKMFTVLLFTACLLLNSCLHTTPPPPVPPVNPENTIDIPKQVAVIQDVRKVAEMGMSGIKTEANGIKTDTASGRKDFPKAPQWEFIDKRADSIMRISDAVDTKVKELNEAGAALTTAEAEKKKQEEVMNSYKKAIEDEKTKVTVLENAVKELQDGAKKRQQMIWMTVSAFSALGFVIGIFLFIYAKSELGISLCVASLILSCVSYFMAAYALYVAIVGGIILLLVMCYLIYFLFINKKALKETVTSFEEIKHKDFNDSEAKEKISTLQSPLTKKIVHDIKIENGLK